MAVEYAWLNSLSEDWDSQPSMADNNTGNSRIRPRARTISTSTPHSTHSTLSNHSTMYHTVQHRSGSLSPKKETPEWKKRLLYGDVAYGEQRDLFAPAGLESIFQPPPPARRRDQEYDDGNDFPADLSRSSEFRVSRSIPLASVSNRSRQSSCGEKNPKKDEILGGSSETKPDLASILTSPVDLDDESCSRNESFSLLAPIIPANSQNRTVSAESLVRNESFSPIVLSVAKRPISPLQNPLAKRQMTLVNVNIRDETRKKSITTQDFLDEAKKIMEGIRGMAKPQSGLTSLEESEAEWNQPEVRSREGDDFLEDDSFEESTKEPFERPPSREGRPLPRLPIIQKDPMILEHLRKYREESDMDDVKSVIASTERTLAKAREELAEAREIEKRTNETISRASGTLFGARRFIQSDPPNITISENPELQRKRKHSSSSIVTGYDPTEEPAYPSNGSHRSSNHSTSGSIPTGSSRGSDSRRVIAPHTVKHLIPEEVADMVFDRHKNVWIKKDSIDDTEDPFKDISDLSDGAEKEIETNDASIGRPIHAGKTDGAEQEVCATDSVRTTTSRRRSGSDQFGTVEKELCIFEKNFEEYAEEHLDRHVEERNECPTRRSRAGSAESVEREISIYEDRVDHVEPQQMQVHNRNISGVLRHSQALLWATPGASRSPGTLTLTPLSEFTVREDDPSFGLNVSYIAGRRRFVHGVDQKRTLSLSIKELVEKLTEAEPSVPYWEDLRKLSLDEKGLKTIHKLDEFCGKVEELDISHNEITQLAGAPRSVRTLIATHNILSDLTAWHHICNLQYLDVSNNKLESLVGLGSLIHLRSIRADNNEISSLDGIEQLDGLLSLRLRGNLITSIDFNDTRLCKLTNLDLKDNRIEIIRNIDDLVSLVDLNLQDNQISSFTQNGSESLKYLRLTGNDLTMVDFSYFPNLRTAYLDRNRLGAVTSILKAKHLDTLSIREQKDGAKIDMSSLSEAFEVRKLFLSGNLLNSFEPKNIFLNLQYLELANCGLESLTARFGLMFPNIRILNLNYNALKDLKPLLGIKRLKRLYIAGNRLSKMKRATKVLSSFQSLSETDLRGNPLTQGFYPPHLSTGLVTRKTYDGGEIAEPFTVGAVDKEKDVKYATCLDLETKTMRRIYELVVFGGCPSLKILDGLHVDKGVLELRDDIWSSLVEKGVLEHCPITGEALPSCGRWAAEDSFG